MRLAPPAEVQKYAQQLHARYRVHCEAIAAAPSLSAADWQALRSSEGRTPAQLLSEQHTRIAEFYGVEEVTPELVELLLRSFYVDDVVAGASDVDHALKLYKDAKTTLQEWTQGRGDPLPEYKMVERTGPDHAPEFVIEVRVRGYDAQTGIGKTKRVAEQVAASRMLEQIGRHA